MWTWAAIGLLIELIEQQMKQIGIQLNTSESCSLGRTKTFFKETNTIKGPF